MPRRTVTFCFCSLAYMGFLFFCMFGWSQTQSPSVQRQTPTTTAPGASTSPASSLGAYVYPRKNQDHLQQQRDETECFGWAKEQTGIDPNAPSDSSSKQQQAQVPKGGAVKGAAAGAVGGTAVGAIMGDTGQGAAAGAVVGAMRGRRAQKKAEKQAEQQAKANAQTAQQQKMTTFRNAFSACMDGRQYSVK